MSRGGGLTIREMAARTGVATATLRMWEARYGFPVPERLPSGHRRYSEADAEDVLAVARSREAGAALGPTIEQAKRRAEQPESSIFAGLRRRDHGLSPYALPKRTLIGLSHAIEDECCARAERPLLAASFQRDSFYRDAQPRWRELARTAELALVFADFAHRSDPPLEPVELPVDPSAPLLREWALVCDAPDYSACLAAWERPGQEHAGDGERVYETIWTLDPGLVRDAVRIAAGLAATAAAPDLARRLLERPPQPATSAGDQLRLAAALTSRMVAYVGSPRSGGLPAPLPSTTH